MAEMTQINVHNLLNIQVDEHFCAEPNWARHWADLQQMSPVSDAAGPVTLRLEHQSSLDRTGMRQLTEHVYCRPGAMLDTRYRVLVSRPEPNVLMLQSESFCFEWKEWAVQLGLLMGGATFIHCAAVERDGRAVIFPSWGGIGKTALVATLIREDGWRLLGDDFVIVTAESSCLGFPKPLVLYPYHRSMFAEAFAAGQGPRLPGGLNELATGVAARVKPVLRLAPSLLSFARNHNPQSRRVSASDVFGRENLAEQATPDKVIWLDRVAGIGEPELLAPDERLASRIMGSSISQWDPWCVAQVNTAMGAGIFEAEALYCGWVETIQRLLRSCTAGILHLPADLPIEDVPQAARMAINRLS